MVKIKNVLISVSDKTGVADLARDLASFGCEFLSTGGTAAMLREEGLKVTDVSEYTGFPEMMDGRVKTLHPKIHGALLALRGNPEHVAAMKAHDIIPIDMVVVNLYPFKKTIEKPGCTFADAIENIDIGGPSMLRSSAKNHESVTVLTDPADYKSVLDEMHKNGGCVSTLTNRRLAVKVYSLTSSYDAMIAEYLTKN
ncbi:MAG: bifunctional phosphoribosylaminoimidazolecarboxamide formyltransferase/IMP cyclohydrolase, partial [Spirochaetota bacterium]